MSLCTKLYDNLFPTSNISSYKNLTFGMFIFSFLGFIFTFALDGLTGFFLMLPVLLWSVSLGGFIFLSLIDEVHKRLPLYILFFGVGGNALRYLYSII